MSDLLSAASLLLTVVAIIYGLWYPALTKALDLKPEQHRSDNKSKFTEVQQAYAHRAIPLAASGVAIAMVFLPDDCAIVWSSLSNLCVPAKHSLIHYDAIQASFVLVGVLNAALTWHISIIAMQLRSLRQLLDPG